jgi:kumamolisin
MAALAVLLGGAGVVSFETRVAAQVGTTRSSSISSPGILIGPARAKSVSFLVLLRAPSRPTCLEQWAASAGLSVQWMGGQRWASISGSPRDVERSFHVSVDDYRSSGGSIVFAANHQAAVPTGVCGEVAGVGTIHSFTEPTNLAVPNGALSSVELLRAYDALPLTDQGDAGQGETIVLLETSGFSMKDLDAFDGDEKLPPLNLTVIGPNGSSTEEETPMDLETAHEIAPDAHLVYFNMNSMTNATSVADEFALSITKAAAEFPGAIFSASIGVCESDTQVFDRSDLVALNAAIASVESKGSTMFASSGDAGGLDCTPSGDYGQPPESSFEGVVVPASLPSVTSTGGTTLTTDAQGNWVGETTWSEVLLSQGTGGGVSEYFSRPSWETGVGTGGQIDVNNNYQIPDVASDSDPDTGNFVVLGGSDATGGGTSLAAPTWAGFTALLDQYLVQHNDQPVGFFNSTLFQLANSQEPYPPFHDITLGGNDFYGATPGYDMATGLGSPNVYNLARDLMAGGY